MGMIVDAAHLSQTAGRDYLAMLVSEFPGYPYFVSHGTVDAIPFFFVVLHCSMNCGHIDVPCLFVICSAGVPTQQWGEPRLRRRPRDIRSGQFHTHTPHTIHTLSIFPCVRELYLNLDCTIVIDSSCASLCDGTSL